MMHWVCWITLQLHWLFGVGALIAISAAGPISGAHLNPAVTIALASLKKIPWLNAHIILLLKHLEHF